MRTLRLITTASIVFAASPLLAQPAQPPVPPVAPAEPPDAAEPAPLPAPEPLPPPVAPAPVEPLPLADAPPPAPAELAAEAEEPAPPKELSVGKKGGVWQPGALLQFWGVASWQDVDDTDDDTNTTFRLRRAELKIKGEIVPDLVGYQVMIDPAKVVPFSQRTVEVEGQEPEPDVPGEVTIFTPGSDLSILQDFFITYITEYADVSLGQFKIPVSLEALQSSSRVIFPERSRVSRFYGDRRDLGVRVEKQIGDYFYYYAGLFNGSGLNRTDDDDGKEAGLRVEVYPIKGVTVGALGYGTVFDRDGIVRDRLEGDLRYEGNDILVQGEYIHGWDGAEGARYESHGAYGVLGYTFLSRIQPVFRIGFLGLVDGEDNAPSSFFEGKFYEGAINYFLSGYEARLALSVSHFDPKADGAPGLTEAILFSQVSF